MLLHLESRYRLRNLSGSLAAPGLKSGAFSPILGQLFFAKSGNPLLSRIKEQKERKEKTQKEEREKQLKQALAQKCADMGNQYASHKEDQTEYTIVTINGKSISVRKEEITLESLTSLHPADSKP